MRRRPGAKVGATMAVRAALTFQASQASLLVGLVAGCSSGGADPIVERRASPTVNDGEGGTAGESPVGGGGAGAEAETGGSEVGTGGDVVEPTGGSPPTGGAAGSPETGGTVGSGGTGATGGSSTGGATSECPLLPNDLGSVFAADNVCGIQGVWYKYNDCQGGYYSPPACTKHDAPASGQFENINGIMCTSGTTAVPVDAYDQTIKWGAGIGLQLNQELPIGDLPKKIEGFRFTVSGPTLPPELRVNFRTQDTVTREHFKALTNLTDGAEYQVLFTEAEQGSWVTLREALDATEVDAIQFQVPTFVGEAIPFDFCIGNLTALYTEWPVPQSAL